MPNKQKDLRAITRDGEIITGENFTEVDMSGANISEAIIRNCLFINTNLTDTCLCYTLFEDCHFISPIIGATDIASCIFKNCTFEGWSIFNFDFAAASLIENCTYKHVDDTALTFSEPPIVIKGLKNNVGGTIIVIAGKMLRMHKTV